MPKDKNYQLADINNYLWGIAHTDKFKCAKYIDMSKLLHTRVFLSDLKQSAIKRPFMEKVCMVDQCNLIVDIPEPSCHSSGTDTEITQ